MTIDVLSASAGAGKTHALAEAMHEAICAGTARPDAVMAITYTNKAAAELARRLRRRLLQSGRVADAARVRDGWLGTVHSICQRLSAELAFEAGTSPYPEPIPESLSEALFAEVTGVVTAEALEDLGPLAESLSMETRDDWTGGRFAPTNWRQVLARLVELARENRLEPAVLATSAEASQALIDELLDAEDAGAGRRDAAVAAELATLEAWLQDRVQEQIDRKGKAVGTDLARLRWVRAQRRRLQQGRPIPWTELAAVPKHFGTNALRPRAEALWDAFEHHAGHPRLRDELRRMVQALFAHAGELSDAFVQRKQSERLLDFEDMLADAADVLRLDEARTRLDGRLDLLLVDEFQDTSPVQLQIVLALSSLADRTIWVGDAKQAIFGFQGSDPALMKAATEAVLGDREPSILGHSYRSRPPLVAFCSELFAATLAPRGFARPQVELSPACPESPAHEGVAAVRLWASLKDGPGRGFSEANGIARHVEHLLGEAPPVREEGDPTTVRPTRPLRAGDVAVLARSNAECRNIAAALHARGIAARVGQEGLGDTPEAWLLRAGLALLADPRDSLAAAEVAWFTGSVDDPDAWLAARIEERRAPADGERPAPFRDCPHVAALQAAASSAFAWTPQEAVLVVFGVLDLVAHVGRWPDPDRRRANLEALRGVADEYVDGCRARRTAATIAGLTAHLEGLPGSAPQAMPASDDAVHVLTYHRSKGLEWPVVVCAQLDKQFGPRLFEPRVEPAAQFDAQAPLAGRSLRWVPTPYGKKVKDLEYLQRAADHPSAQDLLRRSDDESARLLYVGFTRARDLLVLSSARWTRDGTAWLDALVAPSEAPVALPWDAEGAAVVTVGDAAFPCRVQSASGGPPEASREVDWSPRWFARPDARTARPTQAAPPSGRELEPAQAAGVELAEVVRLGARPDLRLSNDGVLPFGEALHGFLGAVLPAPLGDEERRAVAERMLAWQCLQGRVAPELFEALAQRFEGWLDAAVPGLRRTEWPVRQRLADGRTVTGEIDLLVVGDGELVVVDHKSFPGDTAARDGRLPKWAAQLDAYRAALEAATALPVTQLWIHLPLRGEVVRLTVPR